MIMCVLSVLFTATKNAYQMLAVWRMVQRAAYSTAMKGAVFQASS